MTALSLFGQCMSDFFYKYKHLEPAALTVLFVITILQFGDDNIGWY